MFIRNIKSVNSKNYYRCHKLVGEYLIENGMSILSRIDNDMIFSQTAELQEALKKLPIHIKLLMKVGVLNG